VERLRWAWRCRDGQSIVDDEDPIIRLLMSKVRAETAILKFCPNRAVGAMACDGGREGGEIASTSTPDPGFTPTLRMQCT
jgi:hypothetical protein